MEQVRRVRLGLLVGWAVGGVLALWAVMYVLAGSGIARGTTVAGVPIGGRTAAQARALLQQQLGPRATAPIRVRVGDVDGEVSPRDAGLAFDVAATVDAARARSWNPIALIDALRGGGGEVDPVVSVDAVALGAIVDALADDVGRAPQEGGVAFRNDTVVPTQPHVGRTLRRVLAADRIRSAYLRETGLVSLPASIRMPSVSAAEVRRATREFAEPAVSAPVELVVGSRRTIIPAPAIGQTLSMAPDAAHHLQPSLDGERLHALIADALAANAVFSLNDTVGERTAERGFAAGFIINNGKLEVDYGGGVSQLATTTFNTAFFAGLEIVEHHPHSFYISRYPEGRESTVAWGFKDVRVRNDSEHGIFITTAYTNSSVTVRVWGTKRFGIESIKSARYDVKPFTTVHDARPAGTQPGSCVATEGVPGFKVDVFRVFLRNGAEVDREKFHTVYAPENKVICGTSGRQ